MNWLKFKELVNYVLVVPFHLFLLAASLVCVWGWVTITDIRAKCERAGYDPETVLQTLSKTPPNTMGAPNSTNSSEVAVSPARSEPLFQRLNIGETVNLVVRAKDGTVTTIGRQIGYLYPFLTLSENAVNLIVSFAVGYMMSLVILLLKLIKLQSVSVRYLWLRPFTGGLVSASVFLIVMSGGALMWDHWTSINRVSIPVIAAFGSIYCEKFENILQAMFRNKPTES